MYELPTKVLTEKPIVEINPPVDVHQSLENLNALGYSMGLCSGVEVLINAHFRLSLVERYEGRVEVSSPIQRV